MNCTKDEDELERAELRRLQRQIDDQQPPESQEEKDYKEEFFELLDEVGHLNFLLTQTIAILNIHYPRIYVPLAFLMCSRSDLVALIIFLEGKIKEMQRKRKGSANETQKEHKRSAKRTQKKCYQIERRAQEECKGSAA